MKKIILLFVLVLFASKVCANEVANLPALSALQKLMQGNERFASGKMEYPNQNTLRRAEIVKSQHPFAVVLCCSDSRVSPEIIFDRGLGDLFVIRNAGEVSDKHILGSIEYAVEHLGVNLVMVLGHKSCGAVGAAMSKGKDLDAIESIKASIKPAYDKCKKENKCSYDEVVQANAKMVAQTLSKDKYLKEEMKKRGVKIVPAYYDLESGKVQVLD